MMGLSFEWIAGFVRAEPRQQAPEIRPVASDQLSSSGGRCCLWSAQFG